MSQLTRELRDHFQDEESRRVYAEDFLNIQIATQIRALREQRDWTQLELARRMGLKQQSSIARLEDVDYEGWSIRTLKKLAACFDVALVVRFEQFDELIAQMDELSSEALQRAPFPEIDFDPPIEMAHFALQDMTIEPPGVFSASPTQDAATPFLDRYSFHQGEEYPAWPKTSQMSAQAAVRDPTTRTK